MDRANLASKLADGDYPDVDRISTIVRTKPRFVILFFYFGEKGEKGEYKRSLLIPLDPRAPICSRRSRAAADELRGEAFHAVQGGGEWGCGRGG